MCTALLASATVLVLAATASGRAAGVLVVDEQLGPGATHKELFDAVVAAAPGDTILVRQGSYIGFTIDSKTLTITADLGHQVSVFGPVVVRDLDVGEAVALHGLIGQSGTSGAGLLVRDCLGPVWVEDSTFRGPSLPATAPADGARVERSELVSFHRCQLEGARGLEPLAPGAGLALVGSRVHLMDSLVLGGTGATPTSAGVQRAGTGAHLEASVLVAYGGELRGGEGLSGAGPFGCQTSGDGGYGLVLDSSDPLVVSEAYLYDAPVVGGAGGPTAGACPGGFDAPPVLNVAGAITSDAVAARSLTAPTPLRYGDAFQVVVQAQPGDIVFLVYAGGQRPTWLGTPPPPLQGGSLLLDLTVFGVVPLGQADGGGFLVHKATAPALASSATVYLEAVCLVLTSPLTHVWSSGQMVTLLDPGL